MSKAQIPPELMSTNEVHSYQPGSSLAQLTSGEFETAGIVLEEG